MCTQEECVFFQTGQRREQLLNQRLYPLYIVTSFGKQKHIKFILLTLIEN